MENNLTPTFRVGTTSKGDGAGRGAAAGSHSRVRSRSRCDRGFRCCRRMRPFAAAAGSQRRRRCRTSDISCRTRRRPFSSISARATGSATARPAKISMARPPSIQRADLAPHLQQPQHALPANCLARRLHQRMVHQGLCRRRRGHAGPVAGRRFSARLDPYSSTASDQHNGFLTMPAPMSATTSCAAAISASARLLATTISTKGEAPIGCTQTAANPDVCQPAIPAIGPGDFADQQVAVAAPRPRRHRAARRPLQVQRGRRLAALCACKRQRYPFAAHRHRSGRFQRADPRGRQRPGLSARGAVVLPGHAVRQASASAAATGTCRPTATRISRACRRRRRSPQPVDWKTDVYGVFVQASFKFGPYPIGLH